MHRFSQSIITTVLLCMIAFGANVLLCHAEDASRGYIEQNTDTDYRMVIEDDADLLTAEEEANLLEVMKNITTYGNVAFKTIDQNDFSTEKYAYLYYNELFGNDSGTLFLIDMDNRLLWIQSDGAIYRVVTKDYAETITDNVYRDASDGDYYECAENAFEQIFTLLEGERIAQPMKYISNILLAMILALLINFGIVRCFTEIRTVSDREMLRMAEKHFTFTKPEAECIHQSKVYDPISSGGGSSGGSRTSGGNRSSGGSSSSGGGHSSGRSGGGGGHRF